MTNSDPFTRGDVIRLPFPYAVKLGRLPEPLLAQVTQAIVERLA